MNKVDKKLIAKQNIENIVEKYFPEEYYILKLHYENNKIAAIVKNRKFERLGIMIVTRFNKPNIVHFIFGRDNYEAPVDNEQKIKNAINNLLKHVESLIYDKIDLLGVDIGNLYPVTIVKYESDKNYIVGKKLLSRKELFVLNCKIEELFKRYNSAGDKLKFIKQELLPEIKECNFYNIPKYKFLKHAIDSFYEKNIKDYNGTILYGKINCYDNVRYMIRTSKKNNNISIQKILKKFITFIYTGFTYNYLKYLLKSDNKKYILVDEDNTSNYFKSIPNKAYYKNKKLLHIGNNIEITIDGDFLSCINIMSVNKHFDSIIDDRINLIYNNKLDNLIDLELYYIYIYDYNFLKLKILNVFRSSNKPL